MEIKKPKIYLFSGLGADERVFQKLDFSAYEATFIQWVSPLYNESISDYAKRLTAQIESEKPILLGISFGGMTAIEVAKHIDYEKIILLASAKTQNEIPFYFRWFGMLSLHHFLPTRLLKSANWLTFWAFGVYSAVEKNLLRQILQDTDSHFLKWAINAIAHWKNQDIPDRLIHIHGTNDKILPITFIKCDYSIQGGGHLMVLQQHEQIMALLKKML